jgi:hypothetical protein
MGWLRKIIRDWDPFLSPTLKERAWKSLPKEVQQQLADEPWWSDAEAIQQMHAEGRSNWSYSDWDRFNLARTAAKEDRRISQQKAALEADELRRSNALEAERRRKNMGGSSRSQRNDSRASPIPEVRFDPEATMQPGQILKLHVTAADMMTPGDEPNFGWVDPPTENPDLSEDLDLKGLAELFKAGLLTEEEWRAAKNRILNP